MFGQYPYLLPNVACALILLSSFILGCLFLKENNVARFKLEEIELRITNGKLPTNHSFAIREVNTLTDSDEHNHEETTLLQQEEVVIDSNGVIDSAQHHIEIQHDELHKSNGVTTNQLETKLRKAYKVMFSNADSSIPLQMTSTSPELLKVLQGSIYKDRAVIMTCFAYTLTGFIYTILDEVYPLWSITDIEK